MGIAYLRNNVSYGLLRGETKTGSYANPSNACWIPSAARVEYYNLAGSGEWLDTHYPDDPGSYWVNPCHYAKVFVYRPDPVPAARFPHSCGRGGHNDHRAPRHA